MQAEQPGAGEVRPTETGEPAEPGSPTATRWRPGRAVVVVAAAVMALLTAAVITYAAGGFDDEGRFSAEPPACATVEPSLHLLGVAYTTKQTTGNACHLLPPPGNPLFNPDAPHIMVVYEAIRTDDGDAPESASSRLADLGVGDLTSLPGIGDEAYLWNRGVIMRIDNLIVGIVVYPVEQSTDEQRQAFAADVAARLNRG